MRVVAWRSGTTGRVDRDPAGLFFGGGTSLVIVLAVHRLLNRIVAMAAVGVVCLVHVTNGADVDVGFERSFSLATGALKIWLE